MKTALNQRSTWKSCSTSTKSARKGDEKSCVSARLHGALRQQQAHVALAAEQGLLHPLRAGLQRHVGHCQHLCVSSVCESLRCVACCWIHIVVVNNLQTIERQVMLEPKLQTQVCSRCSDPVAAS